MRMMMKVLIPVEQGNKAYQEGVLQKTVSSFVDSVKPEASYFTTEKGKRAGFFFFDMKDSTQMPALAEPFFQKLDCELTWSPVMDLGDLKMGVEKAAKII